MVELATECNLRCSYCAVSGPTHRHAIMDDALIRRIVDSICALKPAVVTLHGHGETTIVPGWHQLVFAFTRAGIGTTICTNLMRRYAPAEFIAFSQMPSITASIDSADPAINAAVRGGSLDMFVDNMKTINSISSPYWIWSTVVTVANYQGLAALAELGHSLGVRLMSLCNLGIAPWSDMVHVSQLPLEQVHDVLEQIQRMAGYCERHGMGVEMKSGLIESLVQRLPHDIGAAISRSMYRWTHAPMLGPMAQSVRPR
jgi:MoaA/NifB/PqqE/SkfB family radical SAM enzyme